MKKLLVFCLLFCLFFIWQSFAGNVVQNSVDQQGAWQNRVMHWDLYRQAREWLTTPVAKWDIKVQLEQIRDFSHNQLKSGAEYAKTLSKENKKKLLSQWEKSFVNLDTLDPNCLGRYYTMDLLSYAYDFPTALTIAVWRKESSCGYYLPKNGDGPFQIVSKDYSKVELSPESFEDMIKDFLVFSKHKINWYNLRNPKTPIKLTYDQVNYEDLLKFSALYNGLSWGMVYGDILPAAPRYFWEKIPWEFEIAKRNGLFGQVLKVLERELWQ